MSHTLARALTHTSQQRTLAHFALHCCVPFRSDWRNRDVSLSLARSLRSVRKGRLLVVRCEVGWHSSMYFWGEECLIACYHWKSQGDSVSAWKFLYLFRHGRITAFRSLADLLKKFLVQLDTSWITLFSDVADWFAHSCAYRGANKQSNCWRKCSEIVFTESKQFTPVIKTLDIWQHFKANVMAKRHSRAMTFRLKQSQMMQLLWNYSLCEIMYRNFQ